MDLASWLRGQRSPAPSARLAGSLKHALHGLHSGILRFLPGRNGSHCPLKQPAVLPDRPQKMPCGLVARLDLEAVRVRRWIVHPAYMAQPARAYHRGTANRRLNNFRRAHHRSGWVGSSRAVHSSRLRNSPAAKPHVANSGFVLAHGGVAHKREARRQRYKDAILWTGLIMGFLIVAIATWIM